MEENIKITVQRSDSEKVELTTHCDSNIDDWGEIFKVILKWLTFDEKLIKELFKEYEEE